MRQGSALERLLWWAAGVFWHVGPIANGPAFYGYGLGLLSWWWEDERRWWRGKLSWNRD